MKDENIPADATKSCDVPSKELASMYLGHFGTIFSNISIVGLIVGVMALLSSIMVVLGSAFSVMFLVLAIIMTCGAVFVIIPNYLSLFSKATKILEWFPVEKLATASTYILPISMVLCAASIVLLCFDKHKNHKGRIIFSSIVLGLLLAAFVAILIKGSL